MLTRRNAYEHLMLPQEPATCKAEPKVVSVFSNTDEYVTILLSETTAGKWLLGWVVRYISGRSAASNPGERPGAFASQKDAQLYFLGRMVQFSSNFSPECIREAKKRILDLVQLNLFL